MTGAASGIAWAGVPALAGIAASFTAGGAEAVFRADAVGLAAAAAFAAFGEEGAKAAVPRAGATALALAVAHLLLAAAHGSGAGGAFAVAVLCAGVATAAFGLAAAGRAVRCPAPAAAAVATAVLWPARGRLWRADELAEAVPRERRYAVRDAVLRVDPFTAAAYGAAGFDRLHAPDVYAETTIASLTMEPPPVFGTAAWWGVAGLLFAAGAAAVSRPRRAAAGQPDVVPAWATP